MEEPLGNLIKFDTNNFFFIHKNVHANGLKKVIGMKLVTIFY